MFHNFTMAFINLGSGYCQDDQHRVMPNFQKFGEALEKCKDYCQKDSGCVAISYAAQHIRGNGLCQLHGASQPDSSWEAKSFESAATDVTKSQGSVLAYSCYKKTTPAPTGPIPTAPDESDPTQSVLSTPSETPAPYLEATYNIAGHEITQVNALVGIVAVSALSFLLII